ncbi:MAG TPA: hypothetical protein PKG77_17195 [Phycisphaerae bacterium]|nr:hypothetical protein [Phycisphaerae bacterium]HQL74054.1 hypothetical protein [Phycisphaerae bacterium]
MSESAQEGVVLLARETTVADIQKLCDTIELRSGVQPVYSESSATGGWLRYEAASACELPKLRKYLLLLRDELGKYPSDLLWRIRVQKVLIVRNLAQLEIRVAVAYDPDRWALIVDSMAGAHDPDYQRRNIHHELYHLIETQIIVGSKDKRLDDDWDSLNGGLARYRGGGVRVRDPGAAACTHPSPGFVTGYAMASPAEDRAELYSTLLVVPLSVRVYKWAQSDMFLSHKIQYLKKMLARYDTLFGRQFWDLLPDYWLAGQLCERPQCCCSVCRRD